jgi:hypothetical protein
MYSRITLGRALGLSQLRVCHLAEQIVAEPGRACQDRGQS